MTTKYIVQRRNALMRDIINHLVEHGRVAREALIQKFPGATIVSLSQMVRNDYLSRNDLDDGAVAYEVARSGLRLVGLVHDPVKPAPPVCQRYIPTETYRGEEMRPYTGRAGANDALALPSRSFGRLHDRRGNPLET